MHLSALTYQQLAGQRLMVGFDGTTFNDDLRFLIGTPQYRRRDSFHPQHRFTRPAARAVR